MEKKELLVLFSILILASFFRLWRLNEIPPGLYPDVALNGTEAFLSLKNKDFKVFYPENYGREGLMMWLIALSFSLFGVSIWSIKIVAAIIGILTVYGLYLLTKEIFSKKVALLSAFFLAVSFWHTLFSRIGFRVILLPFILVFSFYFLFRALNKKRIWPAFFAGFFFGLGFYTYTSFRMAIFILPVFLLFFFHYQREEKIKFVKIFSLFLLTTFFVALPIGIYFLKNPEHFASRATPVTVFSAENPLKELLKSFLLHLGMFNFYGDPNWRHNFAGRPMLSLPMGICFLIGIFQTMKICFRFRQNLLPQTIYYLQLLTWLFVMLSGGFLTREGIPHSLRVAGTIPVVFIFVGLGANFIFEKIKKIKNNVLFNGILVLILITIAIFEGKKYFFSWAQRPEVKSEYTSEFLVMGNFLNSLPENMEKYVIVNRGGMLISWANNLPISAQPLMFLEFARWGELKSHYLLPEEIEKIKIEKEGIILFLNKDEKLLEEITKRFKGSLIVNDYFWAWQIKI